MHKYGCLMLNCDIKGFTNIIKEIDIEDVVKWENEPHITILYGLHADQDRKKILSVIKEREVVAYDILGIDFFDTKEYDVLKFKIDSFHLERINDKLKKLVAYTNEYPKYDPHITIAYLKKGTGEKYVKKFNNVLTFKSKRFKLTMPPEGVWYYTTNGELVNEPQNPQKPLVTEAKEKPEKEKTYAYYLTDVYSNSKSRKDFSKIKEAVFKMVDIKTLKYDEKKNIITDKYGFKFDFSGDVKNHMFFIRWSLKGYPNTQNIINMLERKGYFFANPLEVRQLLDDKYNTNEYLRAKKVPVPRQVFIDYAVYKQNKKDLTELSKKVGGLPAILKITNGSKGKCINKVDDEGELLKVIEDYLYLNPSTKMVLQELIENDGDYRVHVVRGRNKTKVIATMLRTPASKKEIRNNYSAGGGVELIEEPDENIIKLAIQATEALKGNWLGVDIIGKNGDYKILEANTSSGLGGINKIVDENLADTVIRFFKEEGYIPTPLTVGYVEMVEVNGIKYPAKLDTGNGTRASSIHAEILENDGKNITWKDIDGKVYTNSIIEKIERQRGEQIDEHYVINLTATIGERTLQDMPFIVVNDREEKSTPILINRSFLKLSSLYVDSTEKFIITDFKKLKNWKYFES